MSITQQGIKIKDIESGEGQLAADYSNYQLVHQGEFAMNHMDLLTGYVDISKFDGVVSPDYRVFANVNVEVLDEYLLFLFQMGYKQSIFFKFGQGVSLLGRWRFPADNFNNFSIPIPSLEEQKKIVSFLVEKTAKIDEAISVKEQQIDLLRERKQIIIQNAVTKGLNLNAPMKDSGIDCVREIPEHWDVARLRDVFRFNKGLTITKDSLQEHGIPCVNYGEVHSKFGFEVSTQMDDLKFVDEIFLESNPKSLLQEGDFIFADTSEDLDGAGNFTHLTSSQPAFAGYHTIIARPQGNIIPRFLAYVLSSEACRNQTRRKVKGVKVFSVTNTLLKSNSVWFPSKDEQNEIVSFLDIKIGEIRSAISIKQKQINALKEYKTTLINAAVTGKIKVA